MSRGFPVAVLLLALARPAVGQQATSGSAPLFARGDAWGAGGFLLGVLALAPADQPLAAWSQRPALQGNSTLHATATGFRLLGSPGVAVLSGSLYLVGRVGGNGRMAALGLHAGEAILVASAITEVGKILAGRARPYVAPNNPRDFQLLRGWQGSPYQSFPSGHTTAAFAAAAAVTAQARRWDGDTRWIVGPIAYTAAALVGASRIYNDRHWATDVAMAAAIGTFSGWKVVQYTTDQPGNTVDGWLLSLTVQGRAGRWSITLLPVPPRLAGRETQAEQRIRR